MDHQKIKDAMNTLTHGVYVLGVHTPEQDNLMTAAWLCQVSGSPAMLAAAVSAGHLTADLIERAGTFTVSVLGENQREEALACGRVSGRKADKTKLVETDYTESGIPVVKGACAHLECRVADVNRATNHTLFIAEVIDASCVSDQTLLYRHKDFF